MEAILWYHYAALIRYSFSKEGICRAQKQREKVWTEVENQLRGVGCQRDGERGRVDEKTCPLSLELMK